MLTNSGFYDFDSKILFPTYDEYIEYSEEMNYVQQIET